MTMPGLTSDLSKMTIRITSRSLLDKQDQNVLYEAGMAMGLHRDRTIIVTMGNLRPFSDIDGRHVIRLTDSAPKRQELAQRLRTVGCEVNREGSTWLTVGELKLSERS